MRSLNESVREYTAKLQRGQIQKAYKGIMTFMFGLNPSLKAGTPNTRSAGSILEPWI